MNICIIGFQGQQNTDLLWIYKSDNWNMNLNKWECFEYQNDD